MTSYKDPFNQIIREAFKPFIRPGDALPDRIVPELISRFSTAEGYRIYPDVQPLFECIRESRARVPSQHCHVWPWDETVVGIISNSDDRVPSILASLGLKVGKRLFGSESIPSTLPVAEDDISFTVLSYDVGAEKPDGRIFDAAKSLLRASLDDQEKDSVSIEGEENPVLDEFTLLHVGDDLRKDVLGAKAAGWNSILLDRDASYLPRSMTDEQGTLTSSIERITINGRATKVTNDLSALKLWTP
ncbi:MAG: hypothetical protein M1825_000850 [Sarcosagium campestre]|nr:MAG: hypothetical protein M1825_000850 [Sarcosagium campestre]